MTCRQLCDSKLAQVFSQIGATGLGRRNKSGGYHRICWRMSPPSGHISPPSLTPWFEVLAWPEASWLEVLTQGPDRPAAPRRAGGPGWPPAPPWQRGTAWDRPINNRASDTFRILLFSFLNLFIFQIPCPECSALSSFRYMQDYIFLIRSLRPYPCKWLMMGRFMDIMEMISADFLEAYYTLHFFTWQRRYDKLTDNSPLSLEKFPIENF